MGSRRNEMFFENIFLKIYLEVLSKDNIGALYKSKLKQIYFGKNSV